MASCKTHITGLYIIESGLTAACIRVLIRQTYQDCLMEKQLLDGPVMDSLMSDL